MSCRAGFIGALSDRVSDDVRTHCLAVDALEGALEGAPKVAPKVAPEIVPERLNQQPSSTIRTEKPRDKSRLNHLLIALQNKPSSESML